MNNSTNPIRTARLERNWSVTELAERAEVARATIIDAEHERRTPYRRTRRAVSAALGIPAAVLWPEKSA